MRTIPHLRRAAVVAAISIAVLLSACGDAPVEIGAPREEDLLTPGQIEIVESTTSVGIPVVTLQPSDLADPRGDRRSFRSDRGECPYVRSWT